MAEKRAKNPKKKAPLGADAPFWGEDAVMDAFPEIQAYVIRRLGWPHGEDVVQETVKGIVKGLGTVRGRTRSEFLAWCMAIAKYKIINFQRSKYANLAVPLAPEELIKIAKAGVDGSELNDQLGVDMEALLIFLRTANYPCAKVLEERFIDGDSVAKIAECYNTTEGAVRMKIVRCLEVARDIARRKKLV